MWTWISPPLASTTASARRWAAGWASTSSPRRRTIGGGSADDARGAFEQARAAWQEAGREGAPKLWALTYFTLGDDGRDTATAYLEDYYGEWGPGMAETIPADADGLRGALDEFEAAGADEFIFDPVSSELDQLEGLADALADRLVAQQPEPVAA